MIHPETVKEILRQYEKHGWEFRRALVSQDGKRTLSEMFDQPKLIDHELDALWFARRSKPGSETWELRRLTGPPFALVAVIADGATDDEREATLEQVVDEMRSKTIA